MIYRKYFLPIQDYTYIQKTLIDEIFKDNKSYSAQVFVFYWDDLVSKIKKRLPKKIKDNILKIDDIDLLLKSELSQMLSNLVKLKALHEFPYVMSRFSGDKMYGVRQGELHEALFITKKNLKELIGANWDAASIYEKNSQTFYTIGNDFEINFEAKSRSDILFNLIFNARGGYVTIEELCQSHSSLVHEDGELKKSYLQTLIGHLNSKIKKKTKKFKIANNGKEVNPVSAYRLVYFPTM